MLRQVYSDERVTAVAYAWGRRIGVRRLSWTQFASAYGRDSAFQDGFDRMIAALAISLWSGRLRHSHCGRVELRSIIAIWCESRR